MISYSLMYKVTGRSELNFMNWLLYLNYQYIRSSSWIQSDYYISYRDYNQNLIKLSLAYAHPPPPPLPPKKIFSPKILLIDIRHWGRLITDPCHQLDQLVPDSLTAHPRNFITPVIFLGNRNLIFLIELMRVD